MMGCHLRLRELDPGGRELLVESRRLGAVRRDVEQPCERGPQENAGDSQGDEDSRRQRGDLRLHDELLVRSPAVTVKVTTRFVFFPFAFSV